MKRAALLLTAVMLAATATAQESEWTKTEFGAFKVERFWEETVGEYTCSYTLVSYWNHTFTTFEQFVTIRANVFDAQGRMVDTNTRSFFAHEYGPIRPAFKGTLKIPVECRAGQADSVRVTIDSAK